MAKSLHIPLFGTQLNHFNFKIHCFFFYSIMTIVIIYFCYKLFSIQPFHLTLWTMRMKIVFFELNTHLAQFLTLSKFIFNYSQNSNWVNSSLTQVLGRKYVVGSANRPPCVNLKFLKKDEKIFFIGKSDVICIFEAICKLATITSLELE